MPFITSKARKAPVQIYYEDYGKGKPLVFVHGWPLSGSMWEYQVNYFLKNGYRCITYDRRGFGKSEYPYKGFDYDTLAADLNELISTLDLENITLVGFSMGGGEVVRYFTNYDSEIIEKIVLIGTVPPFLLQTEDNPDGVPKSVFEGMLQGIEKDRASFFEGFNKSFYGSEVSNSFLVEANNRCLTSSLHATLKCAESFSYTDFREDLKNIHVPALVIHGTADEQVPIEKSSDLIVQQISNTVYKKYAGGRHGIFFTHKDQLNRDIHEFLVS